jgi:hypothetical protein
VQVQPNLIIFDPKASTQHARKSEPVPVEFKNFIGPVVKSKMRSEYGPIKFKILPVLVRPNQNKTIRENLRVDPVFGFVAVGALAALPRARIRVGVGTVTQRFHLKKGLRTSNEKF